MRAVDILEKRRLGHELSTSEIEYFIRGYVSGEVPDYQASAFLMSCCLNKLTPKETTDLTEVMRTSGDTIDFGDRLKGYTVDKHSTGGVGDKTTLVLGPLVAACGLMVAKMSGRGLGHTGGTLDKLEAIKGLRTELQEQHFLDIVNRVGIAVCGQTGNIVPADKKLYSLRDVTATVEDTSLIAASIMSKKLAISNQGLVLDVKTGEGAFMKTLDSAIELAECMVQIGGLMKRDVIAMVTEMGIPLGQTVGNSLEVLEALQTLQGEGPDDLVNLCCELGGRLLRMGGKVQSNQEGFRKIADAITNGKGLEKFEQMVEAQGGDLRSLYALEISSNRIEVLASSNGYVKSMNALAFGNGAMKLGAGRARKDDQIDISVGLRINKKVGDLVQRGESLCTLYYNSKVHLDEVIKQIGNAYTFSEEKISTPKIILAEVDDEGSRRY